MNRNARSKPALHDMRKPIPPSLKYSAFVIILVAVVYGALVLSFRPKPASPLPFDTNSFVSTRSLRDLILSQPRPNQTFLQRIGFSLFKLQVKLQGEKPDTWSFPATGKTACTVQVLLNDCMSVSGNRYLMPLDITCATVSFGHTNTLNGPQYLAAVEDVLQHGKVGWFQQSSKSWHTEQLALLRFTEQKTVVVLPQSEVADFLRTNGIDPRRLSKKME